MRALVLTLALLTAFVATGCGSLTLKQNAQAADVAAQLLTTAGGAIDAEKLADFEQERKKPAPDIAALAARFSPVDTAYEAAVSALVAYERAINSAIARSDATLVQAPAAALLAAWQHFVDVGDALGVSVPKPIPSLTELAKGQP